MSRADEPKRWLESGAELPAELRDALVRGRDELPDEVKLQRVRAALGPLLTPPAPPSPGAARRRS